MKTYILVNCKGELAELNQFDGWWSLYYPIYKKYRNEKFIIKRFTLPNEMVEHISKFLISRGYIYIGKL